MMTQPDSSHIAEGFTKLTETARRAVGVVIRDPFDLGIYADIKMEANWSTGIYRGTALTIAYRFGNLKLYPKIKRSMHRLRAARLINYKVPVGAKGAYNVLVDGFEVTLGGLKGQFLNAWTHGAKASPDYTDLACLRPEDGPNTVCEPPEDGPIQDVRRTSEDISKSHVEMQAEASALASHGHEEETKDEDSGNSPRTPDSDFVCSVDENELTRCISLWKEILDSSPNDDDFRELLSDGKLIRSLEKNEISLSFLFTWSQVTSDRFRGLQSSRDFRLEAQTVLTRFLNYVKTSSPRKVRTRVFEDLDRFRRNKFAEERERQIGSSWRHIVGTEPDLQICQRWSHLFDYTIKHFIRAFVHLDTSTPVEMWEVDNQIEQLLEDGKNAQRAVDVADEF